MKNIYLYANHGAKVSWLHSVSNQIKSCCLILKVHHHLLETCSFQKTCSVVLMLPLWICLLVHVFLLVCLSNNHQFVVSKAPSFHFTASFWMIFNIGGDPAVPCYEYACLFFGIYSFNCLERDVISHIFPLPCFGRYFEVFMCVCGRVYMY